MRYQVNQLEQSKPIRAISFGPMTTKVVLLVFFAVLLLLYLAQSTQGATRQYEIRGLEDSLSTMNQDRDSLKLESIRLQSLNTVMPALITKDTKDSEEAKNPNALFPVQQITSVPNH